MNYWYGYDPPLVFALRRKYSIRDIEDAFSGVGSLRFDPFT